MTDNIFDNRQRRKFLEKEAKKLRGVPFRNTNFNHDVIMTGRGINEILNQPHKFFAAKNDAIVDMKTLFEKSKYRGKLKKEHKKDRFESFLFETTIAENKSYIIVRKYDTVTDYTIYCISDQESLETYLE